MSRMLTQTAKVTAIRVKSANKHIFRALLSLSSAALIVRIAGMLNQVVASSHFGAGAMMDAYFVAYTLPTVIAYLIIGAIEAAVIPVYSRIRSQGSKEQASKFFSTILNLFMLSSLLLTIFLIVLHRQVILLTAPALDPFRANAAGNLAQFMDPVLFLMVVVGLLECIFNVEGQFGWPAYAGILVPLTTSILVVILGDSQGVVVLCIGMVLGLCLQIGVFIIRARRAKLIYRPVLDLRTPEMGLIFIAIWPVLLGGLIGQASPLVDQIFASLLPLGSISALSYSLKIVSIFSGVVFTSVGRAVLPFLSRQAAANDMKAFKATLHLYLWAIGWGTAVISVFMLLLAHPIVQILFQHGAFTAEDTNHTATTLIGFVFGLPPMALGFVGARAFSALGKNRVLMGTSAFSVVANAVFDYIFARLWQSQGIALATSAVYFCTMFILFITLSRMIGKLNLLTPPTEVIQLVNKLKVSILSFFSRSRKQIIRFIIVIVVFVASIISGLLNPAYTLRIALGSVIVVALLRYRYILLMLWLVFGVLVGSTLPVFNGNNFDSALTVPTLLLMTSIPIGQIFKRLPSLLFMFIFLLWVFTGIGFAPITTSAFLTEWFIRLDFVALSILTIHVVTTQQRLMQLIDIILLVSTFICLYGIYGFLTKQNGTVDSTFGYFRIASIFGNNAPTLALFLSLIVPLALYRAFTVHSFKRIGILILLFVFLVTIALTFTRTSLISIPFSIFTMIFFIPSRKLKIWLLSTMFVLASVLVLMAMVGNIPIFSRFLSPDITTFDNRTILWYALIHNFDPTQLFGKGLNASYLLLATVSFRSVNGTSPHSLFLGTLYDHGAVGLCLLTAVFVALLVKLITGIRKATTDLHRLLFASVFAIVINMILQNLDSNDIWVQGIGFYFFIIIALPFAECWSTSKQLSKTHGDIPDSQKDASDRNTEPQVEAMQRTVMR